MSLELVDDDDVIIRRIPPGKPDFDTIITRKNGAVTPTSATLGLKDDELGISCSRNKMTTPNELLGQIGETISSGWSVAVWRVRDLPKDLEVVVTPSVPPEMDPGHCEIRSIKGVVYGQGMQSKLAKKGRMIAHSKYDSKAVLD